MSNDVEDGRRTSAGTSRGHDAALIVRMLLIAAIVVILVVVALDNREDVRVGYAIGHKDGPIWVVMVCSAVAGVLIGWLIKHRPHHRR
jgi:uncharacterized integral membrane protein